MKHNRLITILSALLAVFILFAVVVPAQAKTEKPEEPSATIVETALAVNEQSGEFDTLIAALVYTGLVSKFDGNTNYTVFAPTDAAFAKLGLNANSITSLPKKDVANILKYHVARGSRYAASVVNAEKIRMLNGQFAGVKTNSDGAFIDDAKIVSPNVRTSNGVIHVIDSVMLP
jgi:uncharacterized surface protein with fasciclin (FAS1) repeats